MAYSDYVPGDVLGSGGFGDVYRALDTRHDRTVALKVYRVVLGPEAETEFHRECRASGRVSEHPSVVTILDSGVTDDNRGFLVFEFIEDGNLTTHIAKHGSIEPTLSLACLLYTSDAADERSSVDLGGRRIIKKKKSSIIRSDEDIKCSMHKHTKSKHRT